MKASVRLKLEMAARVRDFVRAHPDTHPGHTAAAGRLEERLVRAEALAQQAIAGRRAVTGAIAARGALQAMIADLLALLARLARQAAREEPELSAGITRPDQSASKQSFLVRGRVAASTAAKHKDVLLRYGMPDTLPDDLGRMLDEFETALNEKHAGQSAHIGAHADLDAVTEELMQLVRQLDALNRFRFRDDPEALGAWRSARNVPWRTARKERGGGDVRPAA